MPADLSAHWLDWGFIPDRNKPRNSQISEALADASKQYAVKFGINPTRARIHNSQCCDALAVVAGNLGIEIILVSTAYNVNHILLSCATKISEDLCQIPTGILCHTKNQISMF